MSSIHWLPRVVFVGELSRGWAEINANAQFMFPPRRSWKDARLKGRPPIPAVTVCVMMMMMKKNKLCVTMRPFPLCCRWHFHAAWPMQAPSHQDEGLAHPPAGLPPLSSLQKNQPFNSSFKQCSWEFFYLFIYFAWSHFGINDRVDMF